METNDPIPLFLSNPIEVPEQAGSLQPWEKAVLSSRILTTSILIVTAAAIVFAILSAGNPLVLFENATASLFATSAPQDGTGQSMPIIQSTADAQALPPTASEAPTGDKIAVALKTAYESQTEIREPPAEALFKQFQAWVAEEDARAQVVQNTRVQAAPVQKHRHVRPLQNARADVRPVQKHREVRSVQNARAKVRPLHNARQVRPEQDAQVQDPAVQNTQTQWPERKFGWLY